MAKKIRKKDKNVLKWMFTVCKKQVPLMILLVVLNAIYGVSSVFLLSFLKTLLTVQPRQRISILSLNLHFVCSVW